MQTSRRMPQSRSAIVRGSTTGIGLGIARDLAAEGANVLLNGSEDAREIEALRAGISAEFDVSVVGWRNGGGESCTT
jgi:3-hydroxybutyrate dehydrogenase